MKYIKHYYYYSLILERLKKRKFKYISRWGNVKSVLRLLKKVSQEVLWFTLEKSDLSCTQGKNDCFKNVLPNHVPHFLEKEWMVTTATLPTHFLAHVYFGCVIFHKWTNILQNADVKCLVNSGKFIIEHHLRLHLSVCFFFVSGIFRAF